MSRVKMTLLAVITVVALSMGAGLALGGSAAEAYNGGKTKICHVTGSDTNSIVVITVSNRAVAKHIEHGDSLFKDDQQKHGELGCKILEEDPPKDDPPKDPPPGDDPPIE